MEQKHYHFSRCIHLAVVFCSLQTASTRISNINFSNNTVTQQTTSNKNSKVTRKFVKTKLGKIKVTSKYYT